MHIRKDSPGSAAGGHTWKAAGDVVEVPDHLGFQLLAIVGFMRVEPPDAVEAPRSRRPEPLTEPAPFRASKDRTPIAE